MDVLLNFWKETILPQEQIKLLVIGDGPCREELEEQARELGIADMVTFAGKVLHEDIPPYFACCDFYITASTSDTNSISMLEGMAIGLPVLQITDPMNEGQVKDGINGFIFNSAQDMADKIRGLKNMPAEQREEFHCSVRRSVENSGSVNLAQYVLQVYENAIGEKQRRHFPLHIKMYTGSGFKIHLHRPNLKLRLHKPKFRLHITKGGFHIDEK